MFFFVPFSLFSFLMVVVGNRYYIGLNRIEMYDEDHRLLRIVGSSNGTTPNDTNLGHIHACPHSVNSCLPENKKAYLHAQTQGLVFQTQEMLIRDGRVPANLVAPRTASSTTSWLAPLRSSLDHTDMTPNVIYITFDRPTTLSYVKLFNYTKTPSRGVSGFDLSIDDVHVYSGTLQSGDKEGQQGQVVFFTKDRSIVAMEKEQIQYCGKQEQSVLLINERQVMGGNCNPKVQRGVGAYHGDVALDLNQRPQTAAPPLQ